MKKNKELVPSLHKPKKTVQVSVLLPWMIVTVLFSVTVGLVAGWTMHSSALSNVRAEAVQIVKDTKSN